MNWAGHLNRPLSLLLASVSGWTWPVRTASRVLVIAVCVGCGSASGAGVPTSPVDDGSMHRMRVVLEAGEFARLKYRHPKVSPYNIIAAAARNGCGPDGAADYMAGLSSLPVGFPADGPIEMFSLPALVRYLYQFPTCMTDEQLDRLLRGLDQRQRLFGHGTLNHAIMRASSWYLLAQRFPDVRWTDWDGKVYSSATLMKELKSLLARRNWRTLDSGQYEMLSPTYSMVNLFPLLNLIDFAEDAQVRAMAEAEATLLVTVLRAHSFQGVVVPPLARRNVDQRNGPLTDAGKRTAVTQQVLWFYFGRPETTEHDLQRGGEPMFVSMLALSKWRPPKATYLWDQATQKGYAIAVSTPDFSIWDAETSVTIYGDAFIAPRFALGTGNAVFNPAEYNLDNQTWGVLVESDSPYNQIECHHPYWRGNAAADAWGNDRWSPFQQTLRYDQGSAIVLYAIPSRDPWVYDSKNRFFNERDRRVDALHQVVNCRVPSDMDEIVAEDEWVFVRKGRVHVAVGTLNGRNEYEPPRPTGPLSPYLAFKIRQSRTGLYVRVEEAPPGSSFADFMRGAKATRPQFDATGPRAVFRTKTGSRGTMTFQLVEDEASKRVASVPRVTFNGVERPLPTVPIESDLLRLSDGVLDIKVPGAQLRVKAPLRR